MVDDDGSEMIEFPEFLGLIKKGGSKSVCKLILIFLYFFILQKKDPNKKDSAFADNDGLGAIYQFFKDLTSGKM